MRNDWENTGTEIRAYSFVGLLHGIKRIYEEGKAISDPARAYQAGPLFVCPVTQSSEEAERQSFLSWRSLAKHLQPIKSKNKLVMWAKRVFEIELDPEAPMLELKQKILDNVFPGEAEGHFYKPGENKEETENVEKE